MKTNQSTGEIKRPGSVFRKAPKETQTCLQVLRDENPDPMVLDEVSRTHPQAFAYAQQLISLEARGYKASVRSVSEPFPVPLDKREFLEHAHVTAPEATRAALSEHISANLEPEKQMGAIRNLFQENLTMCFALGADLSALDAKTSLKRHLAGETDFYGSVLANRIEKGHHLKADAASDTLIIDEHAKLIKGLSFVRDRILAQTGENKKTLNLLADSYYDEAMFWKQQCIDGATEETRGMNKLLHSYKNDSSGHKGMKLKSGFFTKEREPMRNWVFATDEEGKILLDADNRPLLISQPVPSFSELLEMTISKVAVNKDTVGNPLGTTLAMLGHILETRAATSGRSPILRDGLSTEAMVNGLVSGSQLHIQSKFERSKVSKKAKATAAPQIDAGIDKSLPDPRDLPEPDDIDQPRDHCL